MVRYHYALVDDLIQREEFDRLVEKKINECGKLVDEVAAAMLVVGDLDRHHVKVRDLRGRSSLFCFFAKITSISEPKEFDRSGGEKGMVGKVTVADETGYTELIFWDEQAAALKETFDIGDVVEVIGRHGKNMRDIMPLNIRKAMCEIEFDITPKGRVASERIDRDFLLIRVSKPRAFNRRDGSAGEMVKGLLGDCLGTAQLICWEPERIASCVSGTVIRVLGALEREAEFGGGREIIIDENTEISQGERVPDIPFTPLNDIKPDDTVSVSGNIQKVSAYKKFNRRDGNVSYVRNLTISDKTASVPVVIWDKAAKKPFFKDEKIVVYHALCKTGRFADVEVSVGSKGVVSVVPEGECIHVNVSGMVIETPDGMFIDDGHASYLIETQIGSGFMAEITGVLCGKRLFSESEEIVQIPSESILKRVSAFISDAEK